MTGFRGLRRIFRLPTTATSVDREVDDELDFHIEARVEALVARGVPREDARAAALRDFGDLHAARAELTAIDRRRLGRERRALWWDALRQDVRFAVRTLLRQRGFTAAAAFTLALGIGAATSVFSVVDGVLLKPLPYPNHERLVLLWGSARLAGARQSDLPFPPATFVDVRERVRSFDAVAAFRGWGFALGEGDEPELIPGARVTPDLFRVLGVAPLLGRALEHEDDRVGAPRVVVIGHALWRRRFGADPSVIGRRLTLNGERVTVVGVMPPGFEFPRGAELPSGLQIAPRTELWAPLAFSPERMRDRRTWDLAVAGLLRRGTPVERARQELGGVMRRIGTENGMMAIELGGDVVPMREHGARPVRAGLLLLFGAAGLVLLIACANVANLLIARTTGRQLELAVRVALGAGRARLVRQLVTENVILAAAGGALGVALAVVLTESLLALAPSGLPRLADVAVDARVTAATMLAALATGMIFGLVAALHARRGGVAGVLRGSGRAGVGPARARLRDAFIVAEVAFSLVLLVGAALLAQSFVRIYRVEPGFDPDGVMTASIVMTSDPELSLAAQGPRWSVVVEPFLERVRALPGVRAAGGVSSLPLTGAWEETDFGIVGRPVTTPADRRRAQYAMATPGYFAAMGIPIVRGRAFDERDGARAPRVVVISREAAERYWPNRDPVGERVTVFDTIPRSVIGVVGDVRQTSLAASSGPMLYVPLAQFPLPFMALTVRTSGDPVALLPSLRRELRAVSASVALADPRPMHAVIERSLSQRRFGMMVVGFFAVSALVLALVGLYAVIAHAVSQRAREIGVRVALGARRGVVLGMVLRRGLLLTAIGLAIGVAAALAVSRLLREQLFEVSPLDPATYGAIALLLASASLVASYIPARRASRIDPALTLRQE